MGIGRLSKAGCDPTSGVKSAGCHAIFDSKACGGMPGLPQCGKETDEMRKLVIAAVAVMAVAGGARAAGPVSMSPDDVVAWRKASFDLMGAVADGMKATVAAGQPVKPLTFGAKGIAAWAKAIPNAFPAGTESVGGTKGKPEIWSDSAGFTKAAGDLQQAAEKLAVLADADDKAGFAEQFEVLGKACGACHRGYRAR
jgi:cytochrome c556